MAPERYSDSRNTYKGGIKYVPNYGNRTSGVNPNSSNAYRAASIYNLPYRDSVASYYDISNAAANNARLIAEALERARRAREEAIRKAREEAERRAREEAARRAEAAEAAQAGTPVSIGMPGPAQATSMLPLEGETPGGGVRITDPTMGVPVGATLSPNFKTDNKALAEQLAKQRGMYVVETTTPTGRKVYGLSQDNPTNGGPSGRMNLVPSASADAMQRIIDQRRQRMEGMAGAREGDLTEDILINAWRSADPDAIMDMLDQRYYNKAVEVWGEPYEVQEPVIIGYDEDGNPEFLLDENGNPVKQTVDLDWTYKIDEESGARLGGRPVAYLGMSPERGEEQLLAVNLRRIPAPDADITEWRKFLNSMDTAFTAPKYMPESVYNVLQWMPVQDRVQMQKKFLAAGLYETNDPIKFGRISPEDNAIMTGLMSMANQQGLTWEQVLDESIMIADKARAMAASSGGGGGGGGGGATTTYKQIQYNQTSVAQARSLLIGVLTEALGRYPTDKEVEEFLAIVNKKEKKSPSKTVTQTTTMGDTTRAVTRMTPSTVDVQDLAEEFARGIGGGAEFEENAVDRYLNALLNSLGGVSA